MNIIDELRAYWIAALYSDKAEEFRYQDALSDFHSNEIFNWLIERYSEKHRKYHNLSHLIFLFNQPDITGWDSPKFHMIKTLFFFFHDCIYRIDPDKPVTDNEHQSAVEARWRMEAMRIHDDIIDLVCEAIELSNHTKSTSNPTIQFLLDCDLAILAAGTEDYAQYMLNVRQEYGVVPDEIWVEKRGAFLTYMIDKPVIFQHPFFQTHYTDKARVNMKAELTLL